LLLKYSSLVFGGGSVSCESAERVSKSHQSDHEKWLVSKCVLQLILFCTCVFPAAALAQQEPPYFVTYSSALEEPGNLEIENQNLAASPKNAKAFFAPTMEFEYGVTAWWTAEVYVQGQATQNDSAVFTGFRFESRFRPLPRQYWINPVLYVEYENVNDADKSFLEITGNDTISLVQTPNAEARRSVVRTMEGKLILSSDVKGWNISENMIAEKAVNGSDPWEFGYAIGASRPLSLRARAKPCGF